jgi:hypothetical protein
VYVHLSVSYVKYLQGAIWFHLEDIEQLRYTHHYPSVRAFITDEAIIERGTVFLKIVNCCKFRSPSPLSWPNRYVEPADHPPPRTEEATGRDHCLYFLVLDKAARRFLPHPRMAGVPWAVR